MHTKESLMNDLSRMGLTGSEAVMVHSSMKAIGAVEGRADTVLDALCDYFSDGLLMLPALTWDLAWQEKPVFDVKGIPTLVGILPQLFRQRKGVVRSLHPTHSVSALGKDAKWAAAEDHLDDVPCGIHSAWHKMVEMDGFILMVGCTLTSCTFIHGIEAWLDIPNRLDAPVHYTLVDEDGNRQQAVSRPHKGSPSEQYWKAEQALRDAGALKDGMLGDAKVMVISAKKCYETVRALLEKDPGLFDEEAEEN